MPALAEVERSSDLQQEAFWRPALKGFTAPTPLPFSRPSGSGFGEVEVQSGAATTTDVIAAWCLLLARYSGETDVVAGVTMTNAVPLRVRITPETPARAFVRELQTQLDELAQHAHASLHDIQQWSEIERGTPLFETLLIVGEQAREARAPINITIHPSRVRIAYDRARIDDDTAQRVAGHLATLLAHICSEQPLSKLPILTSDERRMMLVDWNDTARDFPADIPLQRLIEAQAAATPDRVAVTFEDESMTFAELNRRANQIARRIQANGGGPGTFAGVLLERSPDVIAAFLGVLKAGAAYVPLDPIYPPDRVAYMLEDSAAPVLITQQSLGSAIQAGGAKPLLLERGWQRTASEADSNLDTNVRGEDLAYVIYTSGSTGKPKGVQIPHRALVNFLLSMQEEPGLTSDDVVLGLTTVSFDISGLEIWLPLITGARIELVSREIAADGRRIAEVLDRRGVTVCQATPATWRMLLDAGWKGDGKLKALAGGEAVPADLARELLPRTGSFWNVYGPTETTVWSTCKRVDSATGTNISIGRPIANTQVYLLDTNLEPVPVGVAGELHIGGRGVARGYLNRLELTAEKFIDDPFSSEPGARMYKTGDAARYLPNGDIEYLNRLDNQVKLRGYRIELGEIEAALRKHPSVAQAVVVVRSDTGAKVLVAYVIAEGKLASSSELREFLKATLPEYMVPAFVVELEAFPLTPNGKVDRKALPAPELNARESDESFVAPRDEVEARLAEIWSSVLNIPKISIHDNFFDLGGESILALRIFIQIEEKFGKKLPLATLLQASTIAALAEAVRDPHESEAWSPLVPMRTTGTNPPFFCIAGLGGNVLNYRPLAGELGPDQPFYALQSIGLDGSMPLTTVEAIAAEHIKEMKRVQPRGPYYVGGHSFGGVVAFEIARQLLATGEEAGLIALFDSMPVGYTSLAKPSGAKASGAKAALNSSLARRLRAHLEVLRTSADPFAYVREKARRLRRNLKNKAWEAAHRFFAKIGMPMPRSLRNVQAANHMAFVHYRPLPSPVRVIFFYAMEEAEAFTREKAHGWSLLSEGGLTGDPVPGNHLSMMDGTNVSALAAKLKAHIEREARAAAMRTRNTAPAMPEIAPPVIRSSGSAMYTSPQS